MNSTTDWFAVERLGPGTHRLSEGVGYFPCHSYLIADGAEAALIDTGTGIGDVAEMAREVAGAVPRVVLTHSHWDHIGGAHAFEDVAISRREQDGGRVSIHTLTDSHEAIPGLFVENWLAAGNDLPDGFDPDGYAIEPVTGVRPFDPGDVVEVGDRALELVPIPGHSPGMTAVLDRAAGICHGADVLEPGGEIYAQFAESDLDDYLASIDRLRGLRDEGAFETLTLGHGGPIVGADLSVLDDAATAIETILDGDAESTVVEDVTGEAARYSVAGVDVLTPVA